jgi:hypothetical protein
VHDTSWARVYDHGARIHHPRPRLNFPHEPREERQVKYIDIGRRCQCTTRVGGATAAAAARSAVENASDSDLDLDSGNEDGVGEGALSDIDETDDGAEVDDGKTAAAYQA